MKTERRSRSGVSQAGKGQQARPIHKIDPGLSASDRAAIPAKMAAGQESANHSWTEPRSRVGEPGPQPASTERTSARDAEIRSRRVWRGSAVERAGDRILLGYYPNKIQSSHFSRTGLPRSIFQIRDVWDLRRESLIQVAPNITAGANCLMPLGRHGHYDDRSSGRTITGRPVLEGRWMFLVEQSVGAPACCMKTSILSLRQQIRSGAATIEDFAGLGSRCSGVGK